MKKSTYGPQNLLSKTKHIDTDIEISGGEIVKRIHEINNRLDNYVDVALKIKKRIWSNNRCGRQGRQRTGRDKAPKHYQSIPIKYVCVHLSHQQLFLQQLLWRPSAIREIGGLRAKPEFKS